jgi:ABC-type bacteriocin/lantibiotic exporter with double-glycine peptidase domain
VGKGTKEMKWLSLLLVILVPYVSQIGEGADKYKWDCGPANVSMMIQYYTELEIPPDSLMDIIGTDRYTLSGELQYLIEKFALKTEVILFEDIEDVIDRAPVIILIYNHWLLVVGEKGDEIVYHDSLVGPNIKADKDLIEYKWLVSDMSRYGIVVTEVLNKELGRLVE